MRKKILVLLALGLGLGALPLLSGCGGEMPAPKEASAADSEPPRPLRAHAPGGPIAMPILAGSASDAREAMAAPPPPPPPPPGGPSSPPSNAPSVSDAVAVRAPILIYTAQITMAVFEVNASLGKVEAIGRELGGFLAKRDDQSVTIRVPAAVFEEAVKRVEGVGDMLHRNVAAEDVTEEYRDLEVRLRTARSVQARLTELLAKAVKVEESLAIERELDRVTGEIERIEGRIKFFRDQAAFSTITVHFEPKPTEKVGAGATRLPVEWLYDINLPRLLRLQP